MLLPGAFLHRCLPYSLRWVSHLIPDQLIPLLSRAGLSQESLSLPSESWNYRKSTTPGWNFHKC